jgi:[protein-PII] uridylyltransferase
VIETKELRVDVSNDPHFTIEIFTKVEINLGWLLSKFTFLDIAQMDIYKLFDGVKYIKVSYTTSADEHSLEDVQGIVEKSRDMSLVANFARPVITKKELSLDPEHSLNYAAIRLETKNQRGLIALFIEVLDRYQIDIASAKVSTVKNRVRDLFLIEKSSSFLKHHKTVMKELVTPK